MSKYQQKLVKLTRFLSVVSVFFAYLFFSFFVPIRNINYTFNGDTNSEIIKKINEIKGKPRYRAEKEIKNLDKEKNISHIDINFSFPNTLKLKIDPRKADCAINSIFTDEYILYTNDGQTLGVQKEKPSLFTFEVKNYDSDGGKKNIDRDFIAACQLVTLLNSDFIIGKLIYIDGYFKIILDDRWTVLVGKEIKDPKLTAGSIILIVESYQNGKVIEKGQKPSTTDLRYKNIVLY